MSGTESLAGLVKRARKKLQASGTGPLNSMWDVIFDAEAICQGQIHIDSPDDVRQSLTDYLMTP